VAQATPPAQAAPIQLASLSPNQIVSMRGLWDSQDEPVVARIPVAETNALSVSSARRIQTASATRETTASVGPFPAQDRFQDRVPADLALAYAAQADNGGSRNFGKVSDGVPATVTTKGLASIVAKPSGIIAEGRMTQANDRLDNPWMRGIVLAPSVQNSLVVTPVGDPDLTALAQFMTKPGSSVLMTFSNDPYLGMTTEHFTGSAVVFPATVTFGTSRRTASLQ
jgi:hypothetical protein